MLIHDISSNPLEKFLYCYFYLKKNSLFIITVLKYYEKTKDKSFLGKYFENIQKAIEWNFSRAPNNILIEESYYATWADALRKKGKVLYTNVLHCKACFDFSKICRILNKKTKSKKYFELYGKIKTEINRIFWTGDHYADWIDWRKHNYFSSDGNILAILFDISDKEQSLSILNFIDEHKLEGFTLDLNYPPYTPWNTSFVMRLGGLGDYHNGVKWLWIGCLDVLARIKLGQQENALNLLRKISKKIIECNGVYEVYEKNGKPLKRFTYQSEDTFAWSAGLFILAKSKTFK